MGEVLFADVLGYYEKRECPGNRFECRGSVVLMPDGKRVFTPHDKSLSAVEVE